eukprot:NODE_6390_length_851_cov_82.556319_g6154_i0.p1 GENE.NODE_6390_length_851_cov_82.556319_g6154_i0~~NODE_6390_length_851_cov_82.556319_g6154_i0.p1  ORF type:complete len:235 (-),score=53.61 NODE_6390_length_851_cov_82.556319_g6154_i0:42-746(-)
MHLTRPLCGHTRRLFAAKPAKATAVVDLGPQTDATGNPLTAYGKRVQPTQPTDALTEKQKKVAKARSFPEKYTEFIHNSFAFRVMLDRLDKSPAQLEKDWHLAQAYDRLSTVQWEKTRADDQAKDRLQDAALDELARRHPDLMEAALSESDPVPAWLRPPTLTPPVPGYVPGFGLPNVAEDEDEDTLERALAGVGGDQQQDIDMRRMLEQRSEELKAATKAAAAKKKKGPKGRK